MDPREKHAEERRRGERDADRRTSEPTGGPEGAVLPGTPETGRPDRDQLGAGDRMDLDEMVHQHKEHPERDTFDYDKQRVEESGVEVPSWESDQREDMKEFTGQRAQSEDRRGETESDTQGAQTTRASLGMEPEAERTGRSSHVEPQGIERGPSDVERERDRERREERGRS